MRSYLRARDKEALIDLLLDRAEDKDLLRGRLALEAAKLAGSEVNLDAYRQAIDDVIVVHDFVGYREMYDYSQNVGAVITSIGELLDAGHTDEVIALCEHALEVLEDAWGRVDDSDGSMGWCSQPAPNRGASPTQEGKGMPRPPGLASAEQIRCQSPCKTDFVEFNSPMRS